MIQNFGCKSTFSNKFRFAARKLTLWTVPKAPAPRTLSFFSSVSFRMRIWAWLGDAPLGVKGSTSCKKKVRKTPPSGSGFSKATTTPISVAAHLLLLQVPPHRLLPFQFTLSPQIENQESQKDEEEDHSTHCCCYSSARSKKENTFCFALLKNMRGSKRKNI